MIIYKAKQGDFRKNYAATFDIYSMAKKAANEGKELPTGIIHKIFCKDLNKAYY